MISISFFFFLLQRENTCVDYTTLMITWKHQEAFELTDRNFDSDPKWENKSKWIQQRKRTYQFTQSCNCCCRCYYIHISIKCDGPSVNGRYEWLSNDHSTQCETIQWNWSHNRVYRWCVLQFIWNLWLTLKIRHNKKTANDNLLSIQVWCSEYLFNCICVSFFSEWHNV